MKNRDVKKMIANNRSVNGRQVAEALKIVQELREKGVIDDSMADVPIPFSKRLAALDSDSDRVLCIRKA